MPIHKSVLEQGNCQKRLQHCTRYRLPLAMPKRSTGSASSILSDEGDLDYPKDSRPSTQQETDFWESEIGTNLLSDVFSVCNVGANFRSAFPLGAPDPDGWRGREHISPLFLNDDTDAQERIIKHLIVPYSKGEFLQSDLHKCVERQGQGPAPAAPVVDPGPQANSPLLIPPLNQLAQLRATRAHGENAENAQEEAAQDLQMLDQRRMTAAIMKYWAPHLEARALGPPHHRGKVMHPRQLTVTQTIPCISRTVVGQQVHSLLQASMPDDEELECAHSKRKLLHWTPLVFLNSLGHSTGFSTTKAYKNENEIEDWISWNCQQLGLSILHLLEFQDHACTCDRFAIHEYGDHLHSCTQNAGATTGAHEQILTAVQRLFNQAGYATERKNVPHSRGMKKADLHVKDFRLKGIRDVIVST